MSSPRAGAPPAAAPPAGAPPAGAPPAAAPLAVLAALALAPPGCDGLLGVSESEEEMFGEWIAVSGLPAMASDTPSDRVRDGGVFLSIIFHQDGSFATLEYAPSSGLFFQARGSWSVDGSELTIQRDGQPEAQTTAFEITEAGRLLVELDGLALELLRALANPDADLLATWTASAFVYTSHADPGTSVDIVAERDATFFINIRRTGEFDAELTFPDGEGGTVTEHVAGDLVALDGLIWIQEEGAASLEFLHYTRGDGTLTLEKADDAFDFDGDGVEEPASFVATLE